jgi:DNA topoisomerase-3
LKRYLNVNTSLEIKTGVTYGDWYSVDWYHSKWFGKVSVMGSWEKQLKDWKGTFTAAAFINNMKRMVDALVYEVRSETIIFHVGVFKNKLK